jgi:hypothetical protein
VKPRERSGTISKAVACASGESALKSVLIEFVEEAGECDCASVAIPSEFPAFERSLAPMRSLRSASGDRARPDVLRLAYPSRTRGSLPILTT